MQGEYAAKRLITTSNKEIIIFDDLYSYSERTGFYSFIKNSKFTTQGYDNDKLETKGDYNLVSLYTLEDLIQVGLLSSPGSLAFKHLIDGMEVQQIRVNLSTLNDKNRIHVDSKQGVETKTLLYYPNLEWKIEWGGYTIFTDEKEKEIEHAIAYTPGRVIIFDGSIPHVICAPTNLAPSYRFSLAVQLVPHQKI